MSNASMVAHRCYQDADGQWLLDKLAPWGKEGSAGRRRLRTHYLVTYGLDLAGVARASALTASEAGLVLTLPWHAGNDLPAYLAANAPGQRMLPLAVEPAIDIGRRLADILAGLAEHGIAHGNLVPGNILVEAQSGAVTLLDFGCARFTRAEPAEPGTRLAAHGDDLQALGRLLYWLCLGRPFVQDEHGLDDLPEDIAEQARENGLPARLLEILRRLLRAGGYRHARAVAADLAACAEAVASPAASDGGTPPDLQLPQARFGRERELAALVGAYADLSWAGVAAAENAAAGHAAPPGRRRGRPLAVFVDGLSGIGKSAIVADACRIMASHGARVASGKFNQYGDSRPLWALSQALDRLVEGLLAESGSRQRTQVLRIRQALGDLAQVVIDAVPHLGRLLGPQPTPPALSGEASRMRFELLLRRFIAALASRDQPLVLVLDDMHWADPVSLDMLRSVVRDPGMRRLLVISVFRTEAVGDGHPLLATMAAIRADGSELRRITIHPWMPGDIRQLLGEAELHDAPGADPLVDILFAATRGNPLGVIWALRELHDRGALRYESSLPGWLVDAPQAWKALSEARPVDLLARQLAFLPPLSRLAVTTASFLGASFSLDTLAAALNLSLNQTLAAIWPVLQRGLVLAEPEFGPGARLTRFRLTHDIIQQAAHALVAAADDGARHAEIGRALLLAFASDQALEEHLFEIVRHFNLAGPRLATRAERRLVTELNVKAGRRARASGAAAAALAHFEHALDRLDADDWLNEPTAAFDIAWQAAEAAYLATRLTRLDELTDWLGERCQEPMEKVRVLELRIQGMLARNRLAEGMATGEQALALLDVELSPWREPTQWPPLPALADLALEQPADPRIDAALRVLLWLTPCAYITSFELYARVVLTMLRLALDHPGSALTAISFTNYGLVLCGIGRNPEGSAAGELALALSQRRPDASLDTKVGTLTYGSLRHWRRPAEDSLQPLLATIEACLLCGDQEYLGYASFLYCDKAWSLQPLVELERIHAQHTTLVRQFGHYFSKRNCEIWLQFINVLRGESKTPLVLRGENFDEDHDLSRLAAANNRFALFTAHILRAILAWHRGDYRAALGACRAADDYLMTGITTLILVDHVLFSVLGELRANDAADPAERLARVEGWIGQLAAWAEGAPHNVGHKLALARAELCRASGDFALALQHYEEALAAAQATGFRHDQALIAELSGEFFLARGLTRLAAESLHRAYDAYLAWGAIPVAEALLQRHPWLSRETTPLRGLPRAIGLNLRDKLAGLLDEFGLDRVVVRVDGIPNALICDRLPDQGPSLVRAPLAGSAELPLALLELARQSGTYQVLEEPLEAPTWQADPYLAARRPKTVGIWPVRRGQGVVGSVYMECLARRLLSSHYLDGRIAWHVQAIVDELRAEQLSDQLEESALVDPVTRLPNRTAFLRNVDLTLARMRNLSERNTAVAVIHARHFDQRVIVDGRDHGDATMVELVRRLSGTAKAAGSVASLGRNRLGLLYWGLSGEAVMDDCRHLRSVLDGTYPKDIVIETDIAVCIDDGGMNAASALRDAENVLLMAIGEAHGNVILFDPERHGAGREAPQRVELKLRREEALRVRAEIRNREKSRFIASAVHDLRQPLQAIGTVLEPAHLAIQAGDLGKAGRLIEIARKSSHLMRDQLNAILDISRLESGLTEARYTDFELNGLLQGVLDQVAPYAAEKGVQLSFRVEPEGKIFVRSDPQLLQRLLLNLANNGIKYRSADPAGGAFVHIRGWQTGQTILLTVDDNGIGMPQDILDTGAIFEPFFQANNPHADNDKGVGLGLAIVKVILELLPDHRLSVESTVGQGTRFSISLPGSALGIIAYEPQVETPLDIRNLDLSRLYILIVEDDELVMQAMEALLDSFGALHTRATSQEELRRVIAGMEREPDLLLTDFRLSHRDTAIDVIACVSASFGEIPTILLTGEVLDSESEVALGHLPLLSKPIEPLKLLKCIVEATSAAAAPPANGV